MATIKTLHTLNARDNVMLEGIRDYFNLGSQQMFRVIQGMRYNVEEALNKKGINYDDLRSALVPAQDRFEVALVFDTTAIDSNSYGFDVMKRVIPLFHTQSNHSVLLGDYLDTPSQGEQLYEAFRQGVKPRRTINYQHSSQFYFVYINNLTPNMVRLFEEGLSQYAGFAGTADMRYGSPLKEYLSTMLVNSFIKHRKIILQGHEPDRADEDDLNMTGYPFEGNGYICRSISDDLMNVLLSYKIERPVFPGFEVDTEFALNAVGSRPTSLRELDVEVTEEKFEYILNRKTGSIRRAGLKDISKEQLAAMIRANIEETYIYNLHFNEEHNVTKFNIILEIPSKADRPATRLLAALEYQPDRRKIRLITIY